MLTTSSTWCGCAPGGRGADRGVSPAYRSRPCPGRVREDPQGVREPRPRRSPEGAAMSGVTHPEERAIIQRRAYEVVSAWLEPLGIAPWAWQVGGAAHGAPVEFEARGPFASQTHRVEFGHRPAMLNDGLPRRQDPSLRPSAVVESEPTAKTLCRSHPPRAGSARQAGPGGHGACSRGGPPSTAAPWPSGPEQVHPRSRPWSATMLDTWAVGHGGDASASGHGASRSPPRKRETNRSRGSACAGGHLGKSQG